MSGSFPGAYYSVTVGDFNGDKHLDAVLGDFESNYLDYYPGVAGGAFSTPIPYKSDVIDNPQGLDAADFNGDGNLDLLIASGGDSFVSFGNGDGTFQLADNQLVLLAYQTSDAYPS